MASKTMQATSKKGSVTKTSGTRNKSIAAISPKGSVKRIAGSTKQQAGHLVKKQPTTKQGQVGKNGPKNAGRKHGGNERGQSGY